MMSRSKILGVLIVLFATGCDDGVFHTPWHDEKLASGRAVKVTSLNLVWGSEHDDHTLGKDCFAIQYVESDASADTKSRDAEAAEVFELVRPMSEQWGFREATVAGIPTLEHVGLYDLYWFRRSDNNEWSAKLIVRNGVWIQGALSDASP